MDELRSKNMSLEQLVKETEGRIVRSAKQFNWDRSTPHAHRFDIIQRNTITMVKGND
jgi:hypothetical protein